MRVPAWVLWRYLLRRRSVGSTLGATAAVVAVALTFVHQTGTMVQRALDDSVALSQGGAAYVVTDPGADHGDVLREAGFVPVEESLTRVGGTLVQLRSTHGPGGVPGTVVEGRLPERSGEAVVSPELADELGGSPLRTAPGAPGADVVGVVVDPMDPRGHRAAVWTDAPLDPARALWIGARDPASVPGLGSEVVSSQVRAGFGDDNANPASAALATLRAAPWWVLVAGHVLVVVLLAALRQRSRSDVEALVAAGATARRAWWSLHGAWAVPLAVGSLVGWAAGGVLSWGTAGTLGARFGQFWTPSLPGVAPAGLALLALAAGPVVLSLTSALGTPPTPAGPGTVRRPRARRVLRAAATLGMVVGVAGLVSTAAPLLLGVAPPLSPTLAPLWGLLVVTGVPGLVRRVVAGRAGPVQRLALDVLTRPVQRAVVILGVLLFASTTWALMLERIATDNEGGSPKDETLQVVDVPSARAADLATVYAAHDGGPVGEYAMVRAADTGEPLAVPASALGCLEGAATPAARDACLADSPALVTMVVSTGPGRDVLATSDLGAEARIGVVWVDDDGTVTGWQEVDGVTPRSAVADDASVVVVGRDSDLARRPDVATGDQRFVTLRGYGALEPVQQAAVRSYLWTSLPTSFPQTSVAGGQEVLRATAATVAFAAAALATLVLALVAAGQERGTRPVRRVLAAWGSRRTTRPVRRIRWAPATVFGAVVPGTAALCAWLASPHVGAGVGWLWLVAPLLLALAAGGQALVGRRLVQH